MYGVARQLVKNSFDGTQTGLMDMRAMVYMKHCSLKDMVTRTFVIFTRDEGHHTSGWLKNPDYERCFHLSLSPLEGDIIIPVQLADPDWKTWLQWVEAFFGKENLKKVWAESPKSDMGKRRNVWHWRLFCDENWEPILPKGEVYSTMLTELGWKSASQVFEETGTIITSSVDPG